MDFYKLIFFVNNTGRTGLSVVEIHASADVSGGTHLLRPRSCFTTLAFVPAHLPIPCVDTWHHKTCEMKMALQTLTCSAPACQWKFLVWVQGGTSI